MRNTTTAYLAYFDILGFEKIVEKLEPENLDRLYSYIMRDTQWAYAEDAKQVSTIELNPVFLNSPIKAVNVSDSIIFFSKDDSEDSLKAMLKTILKFVAAINMYCAYRGCLVLGSFNYLLGNVKNDTGEIAYNVSAIYGKALIDAYKKAECQEWVCFFIDNCVIEHAKKNFFAQENFENYIEHEVPFKECTKQKQLVLKMTLSDSNGKTHEEQVRELFERNGLKFSEVVRLKYENTLAFRKYCNNLS
jgi:hypothetical protein